MLAHRRVTPSIKFAGTHLYTWVERGIVRVVCLAQEHNTMSRPGLEPGPLSLKSCALTMRPPCLPPRSLFFTRAGMAERWGVDHSPLTNVVGFECGIRRHKWIDFVVASHACSKGFGFSCFPPSTKTDTCKFQFNLETVDGEPLCGMCRCKFLFIYIIYVISH